GDDPRPGESDALALVERLAAGDPGLAPGAAREARVLDLLDRPIPRALEWKPARGPQAGLWQQASMLFPSGS
ncbi:MAG TPA: hypothetical protein VHF22_14330, partial [Planctomycetota bacterium]|nr:hypothetical protein [Planctomycetota bacterium]